MSRANAALLELDEPRPADEKWLLTIHPEKHVEQIRELSQPVAGFSIRGIRRSGRRALRLHVSAVGTVLECCDAVMTGRVNRAFAAVRPPGHHAEPNRAMGFCLFANIAIAARYLQHAHRVPKIAIVDFDVHHGNGTQAAFEDDPSVLFISLHQDPRTCYPGTGYATEVGVAAGRGFTLNIPFLPGSNDDDYLAAMRSRVIPTLNDFRPDFRRFPPALMPTVTIPAQIDLSEDTFAEMTRMLVEIANEHCDGRIVSSLEGGYNLHALGRSVVRHLVALHGRTLCCRRFVAANSCSPIADERPMGEHKVLGYLR